MFWITFPAGRLSYNKFISKDDTVFTTLNKDLRGNPFKAYATHEWTVKNGKMIRFFQAVDTAMLNS